MTNPTQTPTRSAATIHDIYTFYLSPAHIDDKPFTVTIGDAVIKPVYNAQLNRDIDSIVIHFSDARRSLKANKTHVEAIWAITGTDDYTKWTGTKIVLSKEPTKRGGKFTIKISKPE